MQLLMKRGYIPNQRTQNKWQSQRLIKQFVSLPITSGKEMVGEHNLKLIISQHEKLANSRTLKRGVHEHPPPYNNITIPQLPTS